MVYMQPAEFAIRFDYRYNPIDFYSRRVEFFGNYTYEPERLSYNRLYHLKDDEKKKYVTKRGFKYHANGT